MKFLVPHQRKKENFKFFWFELNNKTKRHRLRVRLVVILESVSNLYKTWKFSSFKY